MDQQWSTYTETPVTSRQARYAPHNMTAPQQAQRDLNIPQQIKQDPYTSPAASSRTASMALPSPATLLGRAPEYNDGDGDVPMEDADPYNKPKYSTSRANHQHRHSQQFLQQEESAAARRYSPMNLSPTSPYSGSTQQGGQNYTSFTPQAQNNRQSPTRNNPYMSPPNSYYSPPSKSSLSPEPSFSAGVLMRTSFHRLATTRTSTPAHTIEHGPRELLSAIGDCAAQCRVQ